MFEQILIRYRTELIAIGIAAAISAVPVAAFGFEFVVMKGVEFVVWSLGRATHHQTFFAVLFALLVAELALRGYRESAIYRILHPSASTSTDVFLTVLYATGFGTIFAALMTGGATEWVPMLVRRIVGSHTLASLVDHAWYVIIAYQLVVSFIGYWCHRLAHSCDWWFAVHSYHHEATELNMITCMRVHPLEGAFETFVHVLPTTLLGVDAIAPIAGLAGLRLAHSALIHSNFGWSWGWVGRYILCSPRFHQTHHSAHRDHWNTNFAGQFVLWDWLFGTRYAGSFEPTRYGLGEDVYAHKGLMGGLIAATARSYSAMGSKFVRPVLRVLAKWPRIAQHAPPRTAPHENALPHLAHASRQEGAV